jgi:hypothetical protein
VVTFAPCANVLRQRGSITWRVAKPSLNGVAVVSGLALLFFGKPVF